MKDYQTKDLFDLFSGKDVVPEENHAGSPATEKAKATSSEKTQDEQKNKKKRKPRVAKKDGVYALPVYKAAFDSYKECRFRFRKVSSDGRDIAREVTGNLKQIMVDIELVYWQIKPKTILPKTFELVLETIVIIRAMKDFGDLSTKDFAVISQYTSKLSKNMRIWSEYHNASDGADNTKI